ncbi:cell division protein ZapB [Salmonella enterica subsp. enterica]|nr:cell division protein ZapB [Salmonella enterica subsp. enterica]
MSLGVFEKLEAKYSRRLSTITLLQMELKAERKNNSLTQEVQSAQHQREELERENSALKEQQSGWQERLQALLGRMEESNPRHISPMAALAACVHPSHIVAFAHRDSLTLPPCLTRNL